MKTNTGLAAVAVACLGLAACSPAQEAKLQAAAASPPGQLFCGIQTAGGGAVIAKIVQAAVAGAAPAATPAAVLVTGMSKEFVDAQCAAAARAAGGVGAIAVAPPDAPAAVPTVAVPAVVPLPATVSKT